VPSPQSWTSLAGEHVVALHDRRMRRPDGTLSRANIDHLAVTAAGDWVIDAKTHQGALEVRRSGGLFSPRIESLYINGRDQRPSSKRSSSKSRPAARSSRRCTPTCPSAAPCASSERSCPGSVAGASSTCRSSAVAGSPSCCGHPEVLSQLAATPSLPSSIGVSHAQRDRHGGACETFDSRALPSRAGASARSLGVTCALARRCCAPASRCTNRRARRDRCVR
jgi:hypothetical protein